jgi:hypothetical protein
MKGWSTPLRPATDTLPAGRHPVPSYAHACMGCGSDAAFGFNTRQGVLVWTCMAHRSEGEEVLVVPGPLLKAGG